MRTRRLALAVVIAASLVAGGCRRRHATTGAGSEAERIPRPDSFVRVNHATHEVNMVVLVVGEGALDFLESIHMKTEKDAETRSHAAPFHAASVSYLPLTLGEIRGWQTNFHLYALGPETNGPPPVDDYAKHASALIVVGKQQGDSEAVARRTRMAKPDLPVALLGHDALARAWNDGGRAPVFTGATAEDAHMPALKAAAKACLTDLRGEGPR